MRRKSNPKVWILCLVTTLGISMSSCTYIAKRRGRDLPLIPEAMVVEPAITYSTVLKYFGPPELTSQLADGFVFLYESFWVRERQLNISINKMIARWFKLSLGDTHMDRKIVYFIFNENGELMAHNYFPWKKKLGYGAGLQIFFVVQSVVNTNYLDRDPYAHTWGMECLQNLPNTIFFDQNLLRGTNGVEILGAPDLDYLDNDKDMKRQKKRPQED